MKKWVHSGSNLATDLESVFGMAHITSKRSGLPVSIWSDHGGVSRQVSHNNTPRAKVAYQGVEVSVSISEKPEILAPKDYTSIPSGTRKKLQKGIDYIGKNHDLFLKHYMDTTDEFDDQDLFSALKERGQFK